jgi:hypothetical protein
VRVLEKWKCFNLNTQKLESLVHRFFDAACVPIQVRTPKGETAIAKEWYSVPLSILEEMVSLLLNKQINKYRYDYETKTIKPR